MYQPREVRVIVMPLPCGLLEHPSSGPDVAVHAFDGRVASPLVSRADFVDLEQLGSASLTPHAKI